MDRPDAIRFNDSDEFSEPCSLLIARSAQPALEFVKVDVRRRWGPRNAHIVLFKTAIPNGRTTSAANVQDCHRGGETKATTASYEDGLGWPFLQNIDQRRRFFFCGPPARARAPGWRGKWLAVQVLDSNLRLGDDIVVSA